MIRKPISLIRDCLQNKICEHRDFRTPRHIVVFESDDWGSIRMSNKRDWDELLRLGYAVDKRPYERLDTLESPEDLESLFEVLRKYKDYKGNHPIITANMLMANPDFERIERTAYQEYFFEPIANTYVRYYGNTKVLDLMQQGMEEGLFMPQSHGREHFNVERWMVGLNAGDEDLLTAFKFGMCGISPKSHPELGNKIMIALKASSKQEQLKIDKSVIEGLHMFEQLWGFKSKTFVAPCYSWNEDIESVLAENDVKLLQTSRIKKESFHSPKQYLFFGQKNKFDQVYSIRNCSFEPAIQKNDSIVNALLKQVDNSFSCHKVSVFSSHRINYVSRIFENNRTNTLAVLDEFLKLLLEKYPDVEFLSSEKLIELL